MKTKEITPTIANMIKARKYDKRHILKSVKYDKRHIFEK